ncbi:hypothetical protein [uncultured Streptomyces sp.]|uniref:hypothetical protein n=1 Tax=uncultured Streptomyces sp. TaxID=174707 RepID=UPI00262F5D3A|nr:hypothetical protein [uncultured Streptomyces sp.]
MTEPADGTGTIAGCVPLGEVLARLGRTRPVFHSEADFQHGFARALWEVAPEIRVRLEVPRRDSGKTEHLDLLALGPEGRTAVEFKYFTRPWAGVAGEPPEDYVLKAHAATDLARLGFVRDIARLERFCRRPEENGLALMLTNEPLLWTPPESARRTRDSDFRIHHGRRLTGTLLWAEGAYKAHTRVLRDGYPLRWQPYSELGGKGGVLRCLAVFVRPGPDAEEAP